MTRLARLEQTRILLQILGALVWLAIQLLRLYHLLH